MQPLDIILAVPLAWALWAGWKRGFVVEALNTVGLLLAVLTGFMLLDTVLLILRPIFGNGMWLPILTFFMLVAGVFYAARQMALYTKRVIRKTLLGDFDALVGALTAFIKMSLSLSTFLWLLAVLNLKIPARHTQDTFIYPALKQAGPGFMKGIYLLAPGLKKVPHWIETSLNPTSTSTNATTH